MSWSSLDWWLNFWTVLVVVGVAVEIVVVLMEYAKELREFRRATISSPGRPNIRKLLLELVGAGFVAIGVAGEFAVHTRSGKVESDMRDTTDRIVAVIGREASDADLKRVQLQSRILAAFGPRNLNESQVARITTKLSAFAGVPVDLFAFAVGNPYKNTTIRYHLSVRFYTLSWRHTWMLSLGWLKTAERLLVHPTSSSEYQTVGQGISRFPSPL